VFGANGTNASKSISATFSKSGTYAFLVTITNAGNLSTTSAAQVVVNQTPTTVNVTPSGPSVTAGTTQQFAATVLDQFGSSISSPSLNWSVTGASNSINSSGLFTAGAVVGPFSVTATAGSASSN